MHNYLYTSGSVIYNAAYFSYYNQYVEKINIENFNGVQASFIVYDESEYFRYSNHESFDYPYEQRKTIVDTYPIEMNPKNAI